jgi:hypothetical protein
MAVTKLSNSGIKTGVLKYDSMLAGNAAYDPAATWLIQRVAGTGSSGIITFSNIPQTYQHLQIRYFSRAAGASVLSMTFNGSGGTNYARHYLLGTGTTVVASGAADTAQIYTGYAISSTNIGAVGIIDIHDYASTTKNKTVRSFTGIENTVSTDSDVRLSSGVWKDTSAITSITFTSTDNFATNATFALYGFKG